MACWSWIDTLQDDAIRNEASRAWYQVANVAVGRVVGRTACRVATLIDDFGIAEPHLARPAWWYVWCGFSKTPRALNFSTREAIAISGYAHTLV